MKRTLALILVLILAVMVAPVAAQDDVAEEDESGLIAVTLGEGSVLYVNEAGELALDIISPTDFAPSIIMGETMTTYNYPLIELVSDWAFFEGDAEAGLMGEAVIDLDEIRIEATIGMPDFDTDSGIVTYIIFEAEGIEIDDKTNEYVLPEFETGSMLITMDSEFISNLVVGREARLSEQRGLCNSSCSGWGG